MQRWLKLSKYLPEYGWEPIIYTPENPEPNATDEALLKEIPAGITVLKKRIIEPYGIYKFLSGKKKGEKIEANIISGERKSSFAGKLFSFIRGNFFVPDPRCLWIGPSARYLRKYIKKHHVDAVITSGPPHSMHLIARKLKRRCDIKWIADFRDPWTEIFYFKHLPLLGITASRHKTLELDVLRDAELIVTVSGNMSESFRKRLEKAGTEPGNKIRVIPNGFDLQDFRNAKKVSELPEYELIKEKFMLVHTGILADNGNPDILWSVLGEMCTTLQGFKEKLQIRVMGQTDSSVISDIEKNGLTGNFVNMGYVAHSLIPTWQRAADLLLLPLRKEPEASSILTGKFFEYLASGREILAFGPEDGNLADAIRETGCGVICGWNDREKIKDTVYKAYLRSMDEPVSCQEEFSDQNIPEKRLKYSRERQAEAMSALLDELKQI